MNSIFPLPPRWHVIHCNVGQAQLVSQQKDLPFVSLMCKNESTPMWISHNIMSMTLRIASYK